MTSFEFGDVVLVPFPFTDQSLSKKRPAVVISSAAYNIARRDVVIMAITSQLRPDNSFDVAVTEWQAAKLLKPSAIKPIVATVEQRLVIARLGTLTKSDQQYLKQSLIRIIPLT